MIKQELSVPRCLLWDPDHWHHPRVADADTLKLFGTAVKGIYNQLRGYSLRQGAAAMSCLPVTEVWTFNTLFVLVQNVECIHVRRPKGYQTVVSCLSLPLVATQQCLHKLGDASTLRMAQEGYLSFIFCSAVQALINQLTTVTAASAPDAIGEKLLTFWA